MQLRCLITVVKIKQPTYLLFNWAISGLFLVVFVHFKQLYRIKTIEFSGIQTRIVVDHGTLPTQFAHHVLVGYCLRRDHFKNDFVAFSKLTKQTKWKVSSKLKLLALLWRVKLVHSSLTNISPLLSANWNLSHDNQSKLSSRVQLKIKFLKIAFSL